MPFDPSPDDAWWPNSWPPQNASVGGTPYPGDWTDRFINSRATTPDPLASVPAPFSAAQLGAMAWRPPIFPGDWSSFVPNNFPAAAWPQPVPPAEPTSGPDLTTAPGWPYPQSILAQLAQFAAPAAPRPLDNPGGLFSRDPSIPIGGGLFPYPLGSDPDPTSPFGRGFVSTGGGVASSRTLGMPGTSSAPGWPAPASWPAPLPQLQDPFATGGPTLDSPNSLFPGPAGESGPRPRRGAPCCSIARRRHWISTPSCSSVIATRQPSIQSHKNSGPPNCRSRKPAHRLCRRHRGFRLFRSRSNRCNGSTLHDF